MSDKSYSTQEVIEITARLLGSQPQDLIDKIEENDLSTPEQLESFLKPFAVKAKNDIRDESLNKGYRQASKKTEKLWAEVFGQDITGKKLDDLFVEQKALLDDKDPPSDKSKKVTLQQALQSEEVRTHIEQLQAKSSKADTIQAEYDAFKNLQSIKQIALDELTKRGAQFSQNPKLKALQMQSLDNDLSKLKIKKDDSGNIILLDEDGESPLYNKDTASHWNFGDFLQQNSPLDFGETPTTKDDKKPFVPKNEGGQGGNNFGYSKDQMSKFTYEDFSRLAKEGKTAEAEFIQNKMIENHENSTK